MTGIDVLQSVQFVTVKGKRLAVLDATDWSALVEWLETIEDVKITRDALLVLRAADGDRQRAGWLDWETAKQALE